MQNRIKINGKEYGWRVVPYSHGLIAEVYSLYPMSNDETMEINHIQKCFTPFWRTVPNKKEYEAARQFCIDQIEMIKNANNG